MANIATNVMPVKESRVGDTIFGTLEFSVAHGDLTAAATSEALSILGLPTDAYTLEAQVLIAEYFTGGSVSACTVAIGDADVDGVFNELNCFDTTTKNAWQASKGVEVEYDHDAVGPEVPLSSPVVTFAATGDNVVNLDAGLLHVKIHYKRRVF